MAKETPNSYKDAFWSDLASATESKLDLPKGLLSSIILFGEKSNNDQVSEAGAKSPFQIIPATAKAAKEKYGIDPYLSSENAAEVAGLLLKDSLERNKGNVLQAVAEYHGGTNRDNWGPRTRAYVSRVAQGMQQGKTTQPSPVATPSASTFDRAMSVQSKPASNLIGSIYDAYSNGQMSPEEAAEFEADVNSGAVMLPRGAKLKQQQKSNLLPQAIADAYTNGTMDEQSRKELEEDVRAGLVQLPAAGAALIPTTGTGAPSATMGGPAAQADPSLVQQALGVGEAGLNAVTGATGGTVGAIAGAVKGVANTVAAGQFGTPEGVRNIEEAAAKGAEALTYAPRTVPGQEMAQGVANVMQQTLPVAGVAHTMPTINAAPFVQAGKAAVNKTDAIKSIVGKSEDATFGKGSGGAAALPADDIRANKAANLPVPVELTKGAETRNAAQLAFEKEQMKGPLGEPLRNRAEENNLQALQNFDVLIDRTGANSPDVANSGTPVIKALSEGYKAAKDATRVAYKEADNSPEAKTPVKADKEVTINKGNEDFERTDSVVGYFNSVKEGLPSTELTDAAKASAINLGVIAKNKEGKYIALPTDIKTLEQLRQEINADVNLSDARSIRQATVINKLIDATTEETAGPLYKKARSLRKKQATKYENRAIVARLITNKKGTDDAKVYAEQVFDKSILNAQPDEITFLKRVLHTNGEDGMQAWKELQGAMLQHIKAEATKGMGMDSNDRPLVSPAKLNQVVNTLDKTGKLDLVLGKTEAGIVRDLTDVVKYVSTVPPGTLINNSGTAGTILAAIGEAGAAGALTGLPVPVITLLKTLSKQIKDGKTKAKIQDALNKQQNKF